MAAHTQPRRAFILDALELESSVSTERRAVVFVLSLCGRDVECIVTRNALEQHFWVQPDASEARILKAFTDGRRRIMALAERKIPNGAATSITQRKQHMEAWIACVLADVVALQLVAGTPRLHPGGPRRRGFKRGLPGIEMTARLQAAEFAVTALILRV
jgi:hypothetical protein